MKLTRQAAVVRDHLYANQHLTSWQAEGVYRIRRLASRISELKQAGYDIQKATMEDATGQRYTRYSFTRAQRRTRRPVNEPKASSARFTAEQIIAAYPEFFDSSEFWNSNGYAEEAKGFVAFLQRGGAE